MRVATFPLDGDFDGSRVLLVEGSLEKGPTSTGLFTIRLDDGKMLVRHRKRITPLDEEAEERLKNT